MFIFFWQREDGRSIACLTADRQRLTGKTMICPLQYGRCRGGQTSDPLDLHQRQPRRCTLCGKLRAGGGRDAESGSLNMCEKPVREQKIHVRAPVFLMMSEISCSDICGIMTKHLEKQRSFMSDMCPQKSVFRYAHLFAPGSRGNLSKSN